MYHGHDFALFFSGNVVSGVKYEVLVWCFGHVAAGKIPLAAFEHGDQTAGFLWKFRLCVLQGSFLDGFAEFH
jgi:hypothetical protein